jgi:hypothetical protein
MIQLSPKWVMKLSLQPETGMDYQVVTVRLKDGSEYRQVAIVGGQIAQIKGREDIPFDEDSISEIIVTHDGWDFNRDP